MMKKSPMLPFLFLMSTGTMCFADLGHSTDAKKVEVEVFSHSLQEGSQEWSLLDSEIYNPFSVPITLRDIRSDVGNVKLERSVSVLGTKVWTELKLLQITGGEVFEIDGTKFRLITNAPLNDGELLQIGLDFGPIGWKSYFYQIKDQTKP
jgi:hypothetical protein